MYDVAVVGARCGGAPTAMLLARAGHRVLLVDRASFPSDTLSSAFLWQRGGAKLAQWGLWERLLATGCPPFREVTVDQGPLVFRGRPCAVDGVAEIVVPRRTVLDALLVDAAVEAGCELLERFEVTDVVWDDGRVRGVRGRRLGREHDGVVKIDARFVVGADGIRSTVAAKVDASTYRSHPTITAAFFTYLDADNISSAQFHARPGLSVLAFPTHEDQTVVYVTWPTERFGSVRDDLADEFWAAVEQVGMSDRLPRERQSERLRGTTELPNFYREPAGPGWVLVGDAGHHKDPLTGMGMSEAFIQADLAATAIDDALTGCRSETEALQSYHRDRDTASDHVYAWTVGITSTLTTPRPHVPREMKQAMTDPETADRVLSVFSGAVPYWEVFTPPVPVPRAITRRVMPRLPIGAHAKLFAGKLFAGRQTHETGDAPTGVPRDRPAGIPDRASVQRRSGT